MSTSVELAEAIATALNEAELSIAFAARYRTTALSLREIEDLQDVYVTVTRGTIKTERVTRRDWQTTYKPVVSVIKKLTGNSDELEQAEADALDQLMQEIKDTLREEDFVVGGETLGLVSINEEFDSELHSLELMGGKVFASSVVLEYTG